MSNILTHKEDNHKKKYLQRLENSFKTCLMNPSMTMAK